jgi:hypothetical protein
MPTGRAGVGPSSAAGTGTAVSAACALLQGGVGRGVGSRREGEWQWDNVV